MPYGNSGLDRPGHLVPNMWQAASRPCSMLVAASAGKPMTSPAA